MTAEHPGDVGGEVYGPRMAEAITGESPVCIPIEDSKRLPCDLCGHPMEPEHAHYKCPACHYILPCCGW